MKKLSLTVATALIAMTGATFAQSTTNGVTVSTDPAKIAAVESHAAELRARQQAAPEAKSAKLVKHSARHVKKHTTKKHSSKS